MDHSVGLSRAGPQDVQVGEASSQRLGTGCLGRQRGLIGTAQRHHSVAVLQELGDDGGTDQAGAAGDEDAHGSLLQRDGTLVPSLYHDDGTTVPSL